MTVYRIYDNDGKPAGFFLEHEERLAKLYVKIYGGYYRKETA